MSLTYTPIEDIPAIATELQDAFKSRKLDSLQFRLNQLRNVYFAVKDNADALVEALQKDFNRSPSETKNLEVIPTLAELLFIIDSLHNWIKPEAIKDIPLTMSSSKLSVLRIPLGVVLVIAPFNFPLLLSVSPVVGAIAAGNCVAFKPPETTPYFSSLLTKLLNDALDPEIFRVVNGSVKETTCLLEQKWDMIFYTGSGAVGKIVATAAAKNLTPVVLELGGKSPAIISKSLSKSQLPMIARRVAWGRFSNSGQACVSIDYVLCHESLLDEFSVIMKDVLEKEFFPHLYKDGGEKDPSWTHIIHDRSYDKLTSIIQKSQGVLVAGGQCDRNTKFIAPTVLSGVTWDDSTMEGELFGPILPILSYKTIPEAISGIVEHHDTPLASYIYGTDKNEQKLFTETLRAGATVINDSVLHVGMHSAPFGGIGQSGYGNYHGKHSFNVFTHPKTIMEQPLWTESVMKIRYPPASPKNDKVFWKTLLGNDKVWFPRTGDVTLNGANPLWKLWTGTGDLFSLIYSLMC